MRSLLVTLVAVLLLAGCSALHEGERVKVAGLVTVEGMAWPVQCERPIELEQKRLAERFARETGVTQLSTAKATVVDPVTSKVFVNIDAEVDETLVDFEPGPGMPQCDEFASPADCPAWHRKRTRYMIALDEVAACPR